MPDKTDRSWPDYRAVWRWHFYASLFCIPFVIILSISGTIYLFKPQIETWLDAPYDHLQVEGATPSAADQIAAALSAVPGARFGNYELPTASDNAVRVIVRRDGEAVRVYVHPSSLEVLHTVPEDERFMRYVFRLHGELLSGDRGSMIVELAASWTIVLIVTGIYLWWPRQAKGWGGVLYPRLKSGSRIFWRDLHSVTGIWISSMALFLLLSGLPWAKSWGNYLKAARRLTGTAVAQQDWTVGSGRAKDGGGQGGHGEHGGHGGRRVQAEGADKTEGNQVPIDFAAVDRIVATVRPLELAPPVMIAPAGKGSGDWTAKSLAGNRTHRVNLVLEGATGAIKNREDFSDRHLIDRIVGTGIAAHEGQLFGLANQLLGLVTTCGLILVCASGLIMWWRRREPGALGAPKALSSPRFSLGLFVLVVALAIYLPLFGASLLGVLVIEKTLLARIPALRDWWGLSRPA
ncbi:MAG TPA: PepSY domain-containing protein [Pirellulales bacterium]|jgi:uncharacterized iron-regulated membrane protein